jgi:archaellum component FlaC
MIGTGRQFLEAAVSQPDADESDPLLIFSSEGEAVDQISYGASAPGSTAQTIAPVIDPGRPSPPPTASIPIEPLLVRIESLETALDDSKMQVSALKSEVATLVRAIGDIKITITEVKNSVGSELKNSFGDVNQIVREVKSRVSAVDQTVSDLKNRFGDVDHTVSDLKNSVGGVNQTVNVLKNSVGDVNQTVGDLKNRFGDINQTVGDLKNRVGGVNQTVSDLKSRFGDVNQTVSELKNSFGDVSNTVRELKSTVATVKNTVGDVKNSFGNLRRQAARAAVISTATSWPAAARSSRTASATGLAAIIGMGAALFGWVFIGDTSARLEAVPQPEQETVFVPVDQPVAPPASPAPPPSAAPVPVSVPVQSRATAEDKRVNYVGTLSVDAQPDGEVFVDRQSTGKTPLKLTNLRAGSHLIWVERDGYRRWTRVVQVPADRVTRLVADLEPLPAR